LDNPLRHLGAIGLYLLWIVVGSGLYLYTVLDTGIDAVYHSIGYLSREQWYLGGVLRSLHRYASDGFMLVMMLHLLREWCLRPLPRLPPLFVDDRHAADLAGLHRGHRRLLDRLGPAGAVVGHRDHRTARLAADLQRTVGAQLPAPDSISDRFFTMLVFIHIGVPLLLILGLWAHVHRIATSTTCRRGA
jgi:hypothetical protein